ncbi:MAG: hypothetical protein N3B01_01890 [Verrucomicrobiae bacterium]|nr:hypothetical protein [Verrucomicrobiae bacterium]
MSLLIEAENYTRKEPSSAKFATASADPSASGGACLARFYGDGRCSYEFTLPGGGLYRGWLRYARRAGSGAISVTLNGKDFKAPVPATGALDGPNAWKWTKLFEQTLPAGKHTLVLHSTSIRPDCLFLSTGTQPPTISDSSPKPAASVPPELAAKLAKPIEPVWPDWLKDCRQYQLPRWYEEIRVCAHTRLSLRWQGAPIFSRAGQAFASLGFKEFSRHIKSLDEAAWWPSKVGAVQDWAKTRNVAKEIIDEAHRAGLRLIVYYRHMEDAHMGKQHPDWVCVGPNGKPRQTHRGNNLCFNSPYVDFLIQRQLELVEMGADGFYYDEVHMPKTGCWCRFCREKFKAETGLDHPKAANPADPVYRKLLEFNNATIERAFLRIRRALHARNPQVVMLVGSNTYPALSDPHLTHRLFRIADSMKTEFSLAARPGTNRIFARDPSLKPIPRDIRIGLGYALSRDATDGRPPHVWCHGLLDSESACFATAGMIAHGCVANLDNSEREIPNAALFKEAVALGNRIAPTFAGSRPIQWAAIHFSELGRNRLLPDESAAWKQAIYPTVGAYQALSRARLPMRILTDSQLEEGALDGYRILFLPSPKDLTDAMRRNVARFQAAGGLVVEQPPSWAWHDPKGGQEKAIAEFLKLIANEAARAPVQVFGGPETMHCEVFVTPDQKRWTVALVNDFSWVHTGTQGNEDQVSEPRTKGARISPKERVVTAPRPGPCKGVTVKVRARTSPVRITDLVDGQTLTARPLAGGALEIAVPDFPIVAVLQLEF